MKWRFSTKFVIILILFATASRLVGQEIGYKEVVEQFVATYQTHYNGGPDVRFEKREGSYWIGYREKKHAPFAKQLFYDAAVQEFKTLSLPTLAHPDKATAPLQFLQPYLQRAYQLQPFFGYEGWCYDVIAKYSNQKALSDSAIYALGRAYSACASDFLNNNSGFALAANRFTIDSENGLTNKQLAAYLTYSDSAIAAFERVKYQDPSFLTVVGQIGLKLSQERVASYLELLIYSTAREATARLKPGMFDATTKLWAKNILDACENNAIYIAYGDNDFFPVLYLQEMENYRRDVIVVNFSLLQTMDYLNYIQKRPTETAPILSESFIKSVSGSNKDFFWMTAGSGDYPDSFKKSFATKSIDNPIDQNDFPSIAANTFAIDFFGDTLTAAFKGSYIQRNEIVVLELIQKNLTKQNIYFSGFFNTSWLAHIAGHILFKGFVYQLTSTEYLPPFTDGYGALDPQIYVDWFKNQLIWDEELLQLERFPTKLAALRKAAFQSAIYFQNSGNKAMGVALVEQALFYWPHKLLPLDWDGVDLIEYFLLTGQNEKAVATTKEIVDTLKSRKPKTPESLRIEAYKFDWFYKKVAQLQEQFPNADLLSHLASN